MKKKVIQEGLHNFSARRGIFRNGITALLTLLPTLLVCLPILLLVTGSVMSDGELQRHLAPVFVGGETFVDWELVPDYPTFGHYGKLLFMTPQFFVLFWNSVRLVGLILLGQLLVGVPAAWAFAVYQARGSRTLFAFYIVLMLLPFQVIWCYTNCICWIRRRR